MLLDMRYQNRYVDTHMMGGSNNDVRFMIASVLTYSQRTQYKSEW